MKFYIFQGTTQEFAEAAPMMGLKQTNEAAIYAEKSASNRIKEEESGNLPIAIIKSVLTRRPLDDNIKTMLRLLYEAGEVRVSSDEIKLALDLTAHQFRGMLGAFGRRRAKTEGVPEGVKLLDEHWDHELRQKTWSLSANARKALEDLGLV